MTTEAPDPKAAFALHKARAAFGSVVALRDIDLHIGHGEQVALVGPSGGGKSTFLNLLNASVRPVGGAVHSFGHDLAQLGPKPLRELRASIGYIPQNLGLVPNLRVIQNVLCGKLGRRGLLRSLRDLLYTGSEDRKAVHALLERVGIPEKLYHRTDHLSGGQQQRVAIARALYQEPRALLADEPVSSIDPARARDLVDLLTGICRERELTLVMSIHNLDLAREFFPRLVGLRAGRIAFDQPAEKLGEEEFHQLFDLSEEELLEG